MSERIYEYQWLQRFKAPISAEVAAAEFQRIEHSGTGLTPRAVVDASRPEHAPLHSLFEWDNERAADKWRLDQARQAISSLRVVVREGEPPAPAFAYVRPPTVDEEPPDRSFVSFADVQNNDDLRRDFLRGELRLLDGILQRSVGYEEMDPLREALKEVRVTLRPSIEGAVVTSVAD